MDMKLKTVFRADGYLPTVGVIASEIQLCWPAVTLRAVFPVMQQRSKMISMQNENEEFLNS